MPRSGIVEPSPTSITPGSARLALHALVAAPWPRHRRSDLRSKLAPDREQRHRHRQHLLGLEPGVHLGQPDHRAREQPGAGEQHDRHRDLRDDERALQPLLAAGRR